MPGTNALRDRWAFTMQSGHAVHGDDAAGRLQPSVEFQPPHGFAKVVQRVLDGERDRFFLWAPVCLGTGIAIYFALPSEPATAVAWLPLALAAIVWFMSRRGTLMRATVVASCLIALGFGLAKSRVEHVRAPVLEKPIRNAVMTGVVRLAEQRPPRGQRITLDVISIDGIAADATPQRIRVRTMKDGVPLAPGDRVRLRASLSPPSKPALPGGFDFARTAWFERLGGVGYTYAAPIVDGRDEAAGLRATIERQIDQARTAIGARIKAVLPGEVGAIATALITGERGGISDETNQAFKDSGLFHILSISGLHMVVMAGAVFWTVRLLLAAIPGAAVTLPIKKIAAVAGIFAALVYLAISGGAFATVRAALMISVMFVAVLFDRPALALRNVAIAALLILAIYPESLFDAGFQMSFAAVTGLIAAYEELRRRRGVASEPTALIRFTGFFGGIVASTLIASVAVAPFAAYHFHQSQQYAVLANLIAIPICNFLVMPAALLALVLLPFGLERLALWPLGQGIELMMWCADVVGSLPGAVGHVAQIPAAAFALMVSGGIWLALWQSRMRLLGVGSAAIGLALAPTLPRPDVLIGRQGDLVAVRLADGMLSALPARQSKFELERWLLADGDGRTTTEAQKATGYRCDASGCTATVKGVALAVARHPSAFVDDCARARVLIADVPRPAWCTGPELIVDLFDMWRTGGYALYITQADGTDADGASADGVIAKGATARGNLAASATAARIRIETVTERRGVRPWSMPRDGPVRSPSHRVDANPATSRMTTSSPTSSRTTSEQPPHPNSTTAVPDLDASDAAPPDIGTPLYAD